MSKEVIHWAEAVRLKRKMELEVYDILTQLEEENKVMTRNPEVVKEAKQNNLKVEKQTVWVISLAAPHQV
jgi:hypothetical protein